MGTVKKVPPEEVSQTQNLCAIFIVRGITGHFLILRANAQIGDGLINVVGQFPQILYDATGQVT